MDGRFISYLRVSTAKQGRSGLGLEAQRKAVIDFLNGGNHELLHEYVEVENGKRDDRPEIRKDLKHCKVTGATLVIAKLDRLSRNASFSIQVLREGVHLDLSIRRLTHGLVYEAQQSEVHHRFTICRSRQYEPSQIQGPD